MNEEDVFDGIGIEIDLPDPECFLKIKETLTRIGIASNKNKTLYQSCHILHKKGKYAIVHFKEMFLLDGKDADFSESDEERRNAITKLLQDWKLLKIKYIEDVKYSSFSNIKIIPFTEKKDWKLISKYSIGKKIN